ncbi:MAG TPA: Ca2+-dependent phosphoinositide-specific phospholipase C [Thermoanaerobaculia bacterium]|nr:Ca2+-dependent phosphoinositide-specific phospholipase C [Thermoanaerobaculia bacterium]
MTVLFGLVTCLGAAGSASAIIYCRLDPVSDQSKYQEIFQPTCHNCYEKGVARELGAETFKQVLDQVKNVEIDIYDHQDLVTGGGPKHWFVRHGPGRLPLSGNDNNCTGDGNGTNDLSACLTDIREWSAGHPGHDPITLFLDKKQGFSQPSSQRTPADLDQLVQDKLGSALYEPASLRGTYSSLREAARQGNWPTMANLKGKVLVVLTADNDLLHEYVKARLGQAALFVAARTDEKKDIEGIPDNFKSATAPYVVFYNIENGGTRDELGKITRANNYVARLYFADNENTCRILTNCINDNALFRWNAGACSGQSSGTQFLLDPNGFLPRQRESKSLFTCPAGTVMTGRWHNCGNKDGGTKCDENGNSSIYCRQIEYAGTTFGVGAGSWSAAIVENAGTAYLCPEDTVMTGRRHDCGNKDGGTKCDETGTTQYQCSPLTYQGRAVAINPNNGSWSQEITESQSQFVCPGNQILNGRKHTGDENGLTSYHCIPLPTP